MNGMEMKSSGIMEWQGFTDSPCNLCPRNCMAYRREGEKGYCKSGSEVKAARAALHMWEEPCISGKTGSGAVFFSGCSMGCIYCQNFEISSGMRGKEITVSHLADIFFSLKEQGAANINLVTPDHYVLPVAQAVLLAKSRGLDLPIVYNCSGYAKEGIIRNLKGIVDIFLTDFKYMDGELAARCSKTPDYPAIAIKALKAMVETAGSPLFNEEGIMQKGVIVRHLLLPGHKKNAKAVIRHVYESYGDYVYLSLMNQYTPFERLKAFKDCGGLCRKVTKREYEETVDYALSLGVRNAFIQEGNTAKESFIPAFDGEGI